MTSPGSRTDRLWRELAAAQDDALAKSPASAALGEVLAARVRTPEERRRSGNQRAIRPRWRIPFALGATAALAVVLVLVIPGRALRFRLGPEGQRGAPGRTLVADARSDLPLRFSDGSQVTFRAGAVGRVERLTDSGK